MGQLWLARSLTNDVYLATLLRCGKQNRYGESNDKILEEIMPPSKNLQNRSRRMLRAKNIHSAYPKVGVGVETQQPKPSFVFVQLLLAFLIGKLF